MFNMIKTSNIWLKMFQFDPSINLIEFFIKLGGLEPSFIFETPRSPGVLCFIFP